MDTESTQDFLLNIGPNFKRFTENFVSEGFKTIKELKCIQLPEDLEVILHGTTFNLAEKRQLQCAIKNIQQQEHQKQEIHDQGIYY